MAVRQWFQSPGVFGDEAFVLLLSCLYPKRLAEDAAFGSIRRNLVDSVGYA